MDGSRRFRNKRITMNIEIFLKILPVIIMIESFLAVIPLLIYGRYGSALYWFAAGIIAYTITFGIQKFG